MLVTVILGIAGGLGLFLFGMHLMSEGLKQAAGNRMQDILRFFTKNRLMGVISGALFTAIIQSSSAATVMVVSFVNARLMDLMQATGVILGANIGTTITAQLVAFNLSAYAPVFVLGGVILVMFAKKRGLNITGSILFGFGILFMGISTMKDALNLVKDSEAFVNFFASMSSPMLCVLIGIVMTAVLQSSSAFVGILVVMASQGLMTIPICIYMVLGSHIGQTVSAVLVSFSGRKDAKRAALIHLLFNVFSTITMIIILKFGMNAVCQLLHTISGGNGGREVANAHTLFRIVQVIYLFPFMGWIVKLTYKLVPGEDEPEGAEHHLVYISEKSIMSPTTAVMSIIQEIERMGRMAIENLSLSIEALTEENKDKATKVYETEKYIDFLSKAISNALINANQQQALPPADAKKLGGLFHVVNDLERVGDIAENFADAAFISINDEVRFSDKAMDELLGMAGKSLLIMKYALDMFTNKNKEHLDEIKSIEDEVDRLEEELTRTHLKRLAKGKCSPEAGLIYSDLVSELERVSDHATNIAFAIFDPEEEKYSMGSSSDNDNVETAVNRTYQSKKSR